MRCRVGDAVRIQSKRIKEYNSGFGYTEDDTFTVKKVYHHPCRSNIWTATRVCNGKDYTLDGDDLELVVGDQPPPKKSLGYEVSL